MLKCLKKNKVAIIVLACVLLVAVLVSGIFLWLKWKKETAWTSWYKENGTEFTISSADELYGFAILSKTYDFEGQTIKLGADITVNEGKATDWIETMPERNWSPITGFAGTFDGQGHTISGVFGKSVLEEMGLFTSTKKTCVIRNFKLVNSYFSNRSSKGTGSIIGSGAGTLESIYSDALVFGSNKNVGGLIGNVSVPGNSKIDNCWFDGSLTLETTVATGIGGLVGNIFHKDAVLSIEHSLSTADVTGEGALIGGICGNVMSGAYLRIEDTLGASTITYTGDDTAVGSVVGQLMSNANLITSDSYVVSESYDKLVGSALGLQKGMILERTEAQLKGYGGYQWTTLDFDTYWAVEMETTPVLKSYTESRIDLANVAKMMDTDWYNKEQDEFTITTAAQLYGMAYLSLTETFAGKVIKLGADIVLNEGDAKNWMEAPPEYSWMPIGWRGENTAQHFSGTLDGQGHTISGLYVKGGETDSYLGLFGEIYHTGIVKNLKLTNSYVESTILNTKEANLGAIAGKSSGIIDGVYTDAIVVSDAKYVGGFVGMLSGTGENKVTNCWFDGELHAWSVTGGIVGVVHGKKLGINAQITHCLNTGDFYIEDGASSIGGICGSVRQGSHLLIEDTFNAGTLTACGETGSVKTTGSLLGAVLTDAGGKSTVKMNGSYGVKEFSPKAYGSSNSCISGHGAVLPAKQFQGNEGYRYTTLNFDDYWVVQKGSTPVLASFTSNGQKVSGVSRLVDVSWYKEDGKKFTIKTKEQLYGFAQLSVMQTLEGKTIRLGADITVNNGNAADWATVAPSCEWMPIASPTVMAGATFMGTFDGQGHTISGIYLKGAKTDVGLGLFGAVYDDGVVKNLKLTNSYIEGTGELGVKGYVGSVVGRVYGTVDSVYSDAIVVATTNYTGGIAGAISGSTKDLDFEYRITNCWFDGEIRALTNVGGIAGGVYGGNANIVATIEHCLNSGHMYIDGGTEGCLQIGGFSGTVQACAKLKLIDCLNVGSIETKGEVTKIGSAVGAIYQSNKGPCGLEFENVYHSTGFASSGLAWKNISVPTFSYNVDRETLIGTDACRYTFLDFEKYWAIRNDDTPVLRAFAEDAPDVSGIEKMIDVDWYDADGKEFVITTVKELFGFSQLAMTRSFRYQTVKLGADIHINVGEGKATDWGTTPPTYRWTPIGKHNNKGANFQGTFDGQGHTISGIYVKSSDTQLGFFGSIYNEGVVRNFRLTNSYVEGVYSTPTKQGQIGGVAGRSYGLIENVYCDTIVVNSAYVTGGIVGKLLSSSSLNCQITVRNCQFDGELRSGSNTGGIVGMVQGANKEETAYIEHCLNSGALYITAETQAKGEEGKYAYQVGGVVGVVKTGITLALRDSLNASTYKLIKVNEQDYMKTTFGSAIGCIAVGTDDTRTTNAVLTNFYGSDEFERMWKTWTSSKATVEKASGVKTDTELYDLKECVGEAASQILKLDYANYWVITSDSYGPVLKTFSDLAPVSPNDADNDVNVGAENWG